MCTGLGSGLLVERLKVYYMLSPIGLSGGIFFVYIVKEIKSNKNETEA